MAGILPKEFWTSFENSENKNPCTIVHGIFVNLGVIFGNILKITVQNETWASDKTTPTFSDYLRNVLDKFRKFRKSHPN